MAKGSNYCRYTDPFCSMESVLMQKYSDLSLSSCKDGIQHRSQEMLIVVKLYSKQQKSQPTINQNLHRQFFI